MTYEDRRAPRTDVQKVKEGLRDVASARKQSYIPGPLFVVAFAAWHVYLVVDYRGTARALGLGGAGILQVLGWVALIALIAGPILYYLSRILTGSLFRAFTGVWYTDNTRAYARAGGYDLDRWPRLIGEIGVFYLYGYGEPILLGRSVVSYILAFTVAALVLIGVLVAIAFFLYDRRH